MILFSQAWQELRQHPGRFLATGVAIVLFVAFTGATQVFGATESNAVLKRQLLYTSKADLVGASYLWHSPNARSDRDSALTIGQTLLSRDDRVAAVDRFSQLFGRVAHGDKVTQVMFTSIPNKSVFRWFTPSQGRLPRTNTEVMLPEDTASALGVGIGDVITAAVKGIDPLHVVGLTAERGYADPPAYVLPQVLSNADAGFPTPDLRLVITPNASTARTTPGSSGDGVGIWLLVKLKDPTQADAVAADLKQQLVSEGVLGVVLKFQTGDQLRATAAANSSATRVTGWMLDGASVIAILVGALIVATTFTLLMGQQRRKVGLLRAVGASRRQVVVRSGYEALILGVLGTVVGLPLGIGAALLISWLGTGATDFGVVLPWGRLLMIGLLGVMVTVVAALLAVAQAARVRPLEALRPAPAPAIQRRHRVLGGLAGLALLALGGALVWTGLSGIGPLARRHRAAWVMGGVVALAVAGLATTWVWVPWIVRGLGRMLHRAAPAVRLGAANTVRNPGRVGASTTALLLALGLIITVEVASATALHNALASVDRQYRADVVAVPTIERELSDSVNGTGPTADRDKDGYLVGFNPTVLPLAKSTPGVADAMMLRATQSMMTSTASGTFSSMIFVEFPASANALLSSPVDLADGEVGLNAEDLESLRLSPGTTLTLSSDDPDKPGVRLTVVELGLSTGSAAVTPATFATLKVPGPVRDGLLLLKAVDPTQGALITGRLSASISKVNHDVQFSGGAELKSNVAAQLNQLRAIALILLAVTAVVAVVGVGNTLSLSVMERTRESALLRALGLGRNGLRVMLLVEALLIGLVAVVVGLLAGVLFGWIGARLISQALHWPGAGLVLDWTALLVTCALVVLAAGLASVLPGRKAALAPPVEALADLG